MAAVKICGISTAAALDAAIVGGARWVGLVFYPPSPRAVSPEAARALVERAAGRVATVGLFVDEDPDAVAAITRISGVDMLQLHGEEAPALVAATGRAAGRPVWKALPVGSAGDVSDASRYAGVAERLVYDARPPKDASLPGGNGVAFDWALLDGADHPLPWMLSGGLAVATVGAAIARTGARAVDVSSGVERGHGQKDVDLIGAFLKAAAHP